MYNLARILGGGLMIASAMLAMAANLPDLGLSRQTLAVLAVAQAGIGVALGLLPRVQGGTPPGRRATDAGAAPRG